ncbi:MFS transporter [Haloglycomyces albus]|uniref:MFS transporter n=1 Tax=Haloglycomyces albus TaxID=526067 RepID=UPI00046CA76D|nr:MFS transporter [Haloglycomyces albus]
MTVTAGIGERTRAPFTGQQIAALIILPLPVLLIAVDMTVLGFAVPYLSESLNPTAGQLLWIVDVYGLVLAGLLITMGGIADRIGRRKLLMIGATGFALASLVAAYAVNAEMLIAARVLLGLAGATLMPTTLASLRHVFPDNRQRTLAVAVWASAFSVGAAAGPIVGGWLLTHFWWGSVFLMAAPVAATVVVAAPFVLPETKDPAPGPLDGVSVVLSFAALVPFAYSMKSFATDGVGAVALGALLLSVASGVAFVLRQRRLPYPLIDIELFRLPRFSASVATNFIMVFAHVAALFLLTQYLQLVLGYSPIEAGMVLVPGLVLSVVTSLIAVKLSDSLGLGSIIGFGVGLAIVGYLVVAVADQHSGVALVVVGFGLIGAGIGFAETVTNDAILSSVPGNRAGSASAISETSYELGGALGVAILGSVATAVYQSRLASAPDAARETLAEALEVAETMPSDRGSELIAQAHAAFSAAVSVAALIGAGLLTAMVGVVMYVLRKRKAPCDRASQEQRNGVGPAATDDPSSMVSH